MARLPPTSPDAPVTTVFMGAHASTADVGVVRYGHGRMVTPTRVLQPKRGFLCTVRNVALVLTAASCDPVAAMQGEVRSAASGDRAIDGAVVTVHCPSGHTDSKFARTDEQGHFQHGMVSFDPFEDDCIIHVEKAGYEPVDTKLAVAKVAEAREDRRVWVVIQLKEISRGER